MSGVRAKGQTLIGCWVKDSLRKKIDAIREGSRSQFAREAIRDLLKAKGIQIEQGETDAPDRIGKGGPKRVNTTTTRLRYPTNTPQHTVLNEPSSALASKAAAVSDAAEHELLHHGPKLQHSPVTHAPISRKSRPSRGAAKPSKDKPSPQGSAPK